MSLVFFMLLVVVVVVAVVVVAVVAVVAVAVAVFAVAVAAVCLRLTSATFLSTRASEQMHTRRYLLGPSEALLDGSYGRCESELLLPLAFPHRPSLCNSRA